MVVKLVLCHSAFVCSQLLRPFLAYKYLRLCDIFNPFARDYLISLLQIILPILFGNASKVQSLPVIVTSTL